MLKLKAHYFRTSCVALLVLALPGAGWEQPESLQAQTTLRTRPNLPGSRITSVPPRVMSRALAKAKLAIEKRNYKLACTVIQQVILAASDDAMPPEKKVRSGVASQTSTGSIKTAAVDLLRSLPQQGKDLYLEMYGDVAKQTLNSVPLISPGLAGLYKRPPAKTNWQVETPAGDILWLRALMPSTKDSARLKSALDAIGSSRIFPIDRPFIRGNLMVVRTLDGLLGVELSSGRQLWRHATSTLLTEVVENRSVRLALPFSKANVPGNALPHLLRQRLWMNETRAALTGDDRTVYAIGESKVTPNLAARTGSSLRGGNLLGNSPTNVLRSYDIATGELNWSSTDLKDAANTFYLGPPQVDRDKLFCLVERQGELFLRVLARETGQTVWQQFIGAIDKAIDKDAIRRLAGLRPTIVGNLVICPTAAETVVALDLATRRFVWKYAYTDRYQVALNRFSGFTLSGLLPSKQFEQDEDDRWMRLQPLVVGDRLIIAPRDSDLLVALELQTGKEVWRRPRNSGAFVQRLHGTTKAGEQRLIVIGGSEVQIISAQSGQPIVEPIKSISPFALGYQGRPDHYYLPLAQGEIGVIDLIAGKLVSTVPLDSFSLLGNLTEAQGHLVVQSHDRIYVLRPYQQTKTKVAKLQPKRHHVCKPFHSILKRSITCIATTALKACSRCGRRPNWVNTGLTDCSSIR